MKISITVEINETDKIFSDLSQTEKISIDVAYSKYGFDIMKDRQEKRLDYIAIEITQHNKNVLVGNSCYTLEEIIYLNNELNKYNKSLNSVYIPSNERLEERKLAAIEEQKRWGNREGISDEEIERNFSEFRTRLNEIIDGLKNTSIEVKAV